MTQEEKASRLLELHRGEAPLLLVNVWDAASACIVEQAGLPAIATSSAAVANALGFPDGQKLTLLEMLGAIARIAGAVQVPVTADIEAGFSADAEQLELAMEEVIAAGAVGINLEDALPGQGDQGPLYPLQDQLARIRAARKAGLKRRIHLVINARTDAYWQRGVKAEEALRNTIERGKAYLKGGADCIFVPGLRNPEHIHAVVQELNSPVNILATTGAPTIPELKKLGVKRISMGSGPMRAAMGLLRRIASEAQTKGTYNLLLDGAVPYPEMNALLNSKPK
ncbi:MAG TPA: isocitrate lyase/phosphoenolpyruvate mutase family protein [Candidatus Angelobacter sp.]|nr:isocitrate lyase/phosphoenolpyruvate mutase family protein [Candidatus Angelobacter sp.]